jgi:hypothetical protein
MDEVKHEYIDDDDDEMNGRGAWNTVKLGKKFLKMSHS